MTVPSKMRAVLLRDGEGADGLYVGETDVPAIGDQEVLIKVAAAGVNRPDILQRDGLYPAPQGHSPLLGLEVAGEVVDVGCDVSEIRVGHQVTALVNGGGYSEYCAAHQSRVLAVPGSLSMIEAGGLPETCFTVWHNVFERGNLQRGEWLLVHGGSSGIGTTAIQIAKALGAFVLVTAGTDEKCSACLALGADGAINYRKEDFVAGAKTLTEGRGVNVILDMVGGDYIAQHFAVAAPDGRIVQIAFLSGATREVNFMPLMLKRLTLTGSTLRARDENFKGRLAHSVRESVWPLIENGKFKPVIAATFPLDDAGAAHRLMESSQHIGKIILTTET